MASEMLYPIMPLFLKQIGYSALFIGILEGFAEAVSGLSKGYFGRKSDLMGKRLPFVQAGYSLSALSKPMLAVFIYPWWIFLSRTIDRIGKGLRTGARDAMLSDECEPSTKARVFGFHRSMDTMGAVFGPALALVYLYFYPGNYKTLFVIAFFPGLLAIACTMLMKEKKLQPAKTEKKINSISFGRYWSEAPAAYRSLLTGLLLFALVNSSDVFLLLRMKEAGLKDTYIIGIYIFYNAIYALLAYPVGILADKLGVKKIFIFGLLVFVIVYTGFALNQNMYVFLALFVLYGLYAAATEGISKAWISNIVPKTETATAIGSYSGLQSLAALLASSVCGFIWFKFGALSSFLFTAFVALAAALYLLKFAVYRKPA